MIEKIEKALTNKRRKYIYRCATAGLIVLGVYGLVTADQAAAWGLLAAAVTGMADVKTDPAGDVGQP